MPVAVLLVPADAGFLLTRRAEAVGHGKLALPGGFIDFGETWQRACVKELFEETGLTISADDVTCAGVRSSPDGFLLVFGRGPRLREVDLPPFVPNAEVSERLVTRAEVPLAFPLHGDMLRASPCGRHREREVPLLAP